MELIKGFDRKRLYLALFGVLGFLIVLAAADAGIESWRAMKKVLNSKKKEVARFEELEADYIRKKEVLDSLRKRAFSPDGKRSTVSIIEAMGRDLGIKDRITSIKTIEEGSKNGFMVREARVEIERIGLNELVNLLYMIEKNRRALLIIKKFSMNSRFDAPKLYDVELEIRHVREAPPEGRGFTSSGGSTP